MGWFGPSYGCWLIHTAMDTYKGERCRIVGSPDQISFYTSTHSAVIDTRSVSNSSMNCWVSISPEFTPTCSLRTRTFIPAYRRYSSRIDDSAQRWSLRQHPTTVPVLCRPMLQHTSAGNVLTCRRRVRAWMMSGSVGGGSGGRWSGCVSECELRSLIAV